MTAIFEKPIALKYFSLRRLANHQVRRTCGKKQGRCLKQSCAILLEGVFIYLVVLSVC